jgi:hypothetical protein
MTACRQYDTVAFDVRENATMLFFARTTAGGDIEDYLLIVRTIDEDFDDAVFIEVNEEQLPGNDVLSEATMSGNMLTLTFARPVRALGNESEIMLVFDDSAENRTSMETGAFRVLGEKLAGGHA